MPTIYVNPNGADGNHGRAPEHALRTFAAAFQLLEAHGPILEGDWVVQAAPGVYQVNAGQHTHRTQSINRVVVKGPPAGHPNVPAAVIDGSGGGPYQHGLSASGLGVHVEFRDLKFVGFDAGPGDSSRIGALGENEASVLFTNVHVDGATWCGVYAFNTVRARVNGGVFTGCRSGVVVNDTEATVRGPIVRGSTETGIYWSRGSQGHMDYVTFEDNAIGYTVGEGSRVDVVSPTFRRNRYNVRAHTGGIYTLRETEAHDVGGVDGPLVQAVQHFAGSGEATARGSVHEWLRVEGTRSSMVHTGTTVPTPIYTPYRLPAGMFGTQVKLTTYGVVDSSSAGSSLWADFGGLTVSAPLPVVEVDAPFEFEATFMDAPGGHQAFGRLHIDGHPTRMTRARGAVDTDQTQPVTFGATLGAATDRLFYARSDVYTI